MGVADLQHRLGRIVAIWIVLWLAMPMGFWGQLAAFALFRFSTPPSPAPWPADRLFKALAGRGGWGILFDDLVAAGCTLLVWRCGAT